MKISFFSENGSEFRFQPENETITYKIQFSEFHSVHASEERKKEREILNQFIQNHSYASQSYQFNNISGLLFSFFLFQFRIQQIKKM